MKKLRKISKVYYLRQIMACWLVSFMALGIPAQVAMAGPPIPTPIPDLTAGPDGFAVGTGSVLQGANGNAWTNVTVQTPESIIHWETIDTLSGEDLNYLQDGVAGAAVLNRVTSGIGTQFLGDLSAQAGMKIFIINTAGIVFGSTATVNVSQLVASSLDIADADFLNGLPYTFTEDPTLGGARVINYSTDITAEAIALISEVVVNRGSLVSNAEGGYVIMAAGETVTISENSPVSVVVTMPDHTPGDYDYYVDNGVGPHSDPGGGNIEADHVILAAGDIWSSAIEGVETLRAEAKGNVKFSGPIYAYAEAASDAVADVTIITGGDFTVGDQIMAEAEATGGGDNATATVTINADGDVDISASVETYAKTDEGAGNATAKTTVTAANVTLDGGGGIGADAYAENGSGNATANVDITTTSSDVFVVNDSWIWSYAEASDGSGESTSKITVDADNVTVKNFSGIYAETEAYRGSGDTAATVDIDADGDVLVVTDDWDGSSYITSDAYSDNAGDTTATVDIYATGDVIVNVSAVDKLSYIGSEASSYDADNAKAETIVDAGGDVIVISNEGTGRVYAWAHDGSTNTADVKINAGGNVEASGMFGGGEAEIEADTWNGTDNISNIYITANDGHVWLIGALGGIAVVGADADNGFNNSANVTVTAKGEKGEGNDGCVIVEATSGGEAGIDAEACGAENSNSADVTINADEDVKVEAYWGDSDAWIEAYASNDDETNTANITINAGGDVEVTATDHSEAQIRAEAEDGQSNTADVQINADGDVKVQADAGPDEWSGAKIEAEADEGQNNTANVTVDTLGDVDVIANHGSAEIRAEAEDGENNTATVEVIADGDVTVKADRIFVGRSAGAKIEAEAEDGINNTAEIVIDAVGDVLLMATAGYNTGAEITAKAENAEDDSVYIGDGDVLSLDNTAKVDITARSVEVRGENDGEANIEAIAGNEIRMYGDIDTAEITLKDIKNDADIIITTAADDDGDVEGEGPVVDNGDVLVMGYNGGSGDIDTEAYNEITHDSYDYSLDLTIQGPVENSADIVINAGDDVSAIAEEGGVAEIDSEAWNYLYDYQYMMTLIEEGPVKNSAGVDITAGDDVEVMSLWDSYAYTGAHAWNESSVLPEIFPDTKTNIATVNINAGGDVEMLTEYGSWVEIAAWADFATTNTATVAIDADGGVEVTAMDGSNAGIRALSELSINSNTSDIEINAEHVEVFALFDSSSEIKAEASGAYEEDSENSADVTIYTHAVMEPDGELEENGNGDDGDYHGDVTVTAVFGSNASIEAMTGNAYTNTSDVLLCTDGDVRLEGIFGGDARILAEAIEAYSNTATIGIGAKGDEGVDVRAEDGSAFIEAMAQYGYTNTAETIVCTEGGVQVVDLGGRPYTAGITAKALRNYLKTLNFADKPSVDLN